MFKQNERFGSPLINFPVTTAHPSGAQATAWRRPPLPHEGFLLVQEKVGFVVVGLIIGTREV